MNKEKMTRCDLCGKKAKDEGEEKINLCADCKQKFYWMREMTAIQFMLIYCREHGKAITRGGLYWSGNKYGFLTKGEDGHVILNKTKFLNWFNASKKKVPEGYYPVKELADMLGISLGECYSLVKLPEIGAKRFGVGAGVIYADVKRMRKFLSENGD